MVGGPAFGPSLLKPSLLLPLSYVGVDLSSAFHDAGRETALPAAATRVADALLGRETTVPDSKVAYLRAMGNTNCRRGNLEKPSAVSPTPLAEVFRPSG